jgi:hypothetical protein
MKPCTRENEPELGKQASFGIRQKRAHFYNNREGIMGRLGTREGEIMKDDNDASERTIWKTMIKQNMVPLNGNGTDCTYVLDDKKNSAVEIHFGTRYLIPPRQLSQVEPAVGRKRDSLDISSAEFLILNRNPALNTCRQYIPWKKIFEIVFLDA